MPPYGSDHGSVNRETNNYEGGKAGSKVPINYGPATGARHTNPAESGGVFRGTKGAVLGGPRQGGEK